MEKNYNIARLMRDIQNDLIANMKRNLTHHKLEEKEFQAVWQSWQSLSLMQFEKYVKENQAIVNNYQPQLDAAVKHLIQKEYRQGSLAFEKAIGHNKLEVGWFSKNERKINALIKASQKDFNKATYSMLRTIDDDYRKICWNSSMYSAMGTKTTEQAVNLMIDELYKNGVKTITYKNGSKHSVDDYSRMCIRTTEKRAYLSGEGSKRDEYHEYLCKMSTHLHCCGACADWEGGIYVDDVFASPSDEEINRLLDKGYTLLSDAIDGGAFHVSCRHTLSVYIELD